MKRFFIVFTGRVQGVGFRWQLQQYAVSKGVTGWAENKENGNVECQMQGNEDDINQIISKMFTASRFISIEDYAIKEIPLVENEKRFRVL